MLTLRNRQFDQKSPVQPIPEFREDPLSIIIARCPFPTHVEYVKETMWIQGYQVFHGLENGLFLVHLWCSFLLITCFCNHISLRNKLNAYTLHTFLTLSAFLLHNTASHLKHLHILYRVKVKNQKKLLSSWLHHKNETFLGIINICIFYVRPWVN